VGGAHYDQPLVVHLDPRVKTPAVALSQLATLSRDMYDRAVATRAALASARALDTKLHAMQGADVDAFRAKVEALAPDSSADEGGRGRRRAAARNETLTFEHVRNALMAAAMSMQGADIAPTAAEIAACSRARSRYETIMSRWNALRTTELGALNAKRKAAGESMISTVP